VTANSIATERLVLRIPRLDDAPKIFSAYARDEAVTRFLAWRPHANAGETQAFLGKLLCAEREGATCPYVITLREAESEPIGMIEARSTPHGAAFGYVLAQKWWGRGLMSEALTEMVSRVLSRPDIWRTYAFCDVENAASAAVMRRAGMECEGVLRKWLVHPNTGSEPRDCYSFARVK
jgi:RimJ/RimL family protein N-acetyltransferase